MYDQQNLILVQDTCSYLWILVDLLVLSEVSNRMKSSVGIIF
jgi:hypothetical protein